MYIGVRQTTKRSKNMTDKNFAIQAIRRVAILGNADCLTDLEVKAVRNYPTERINGLTTRLVSAFALIINTQTDDTIDTGKLRALAA